MAGSSLRFWIPALIAVILSSLPFSHGQDFTCGPNKPCQIGCCSKDGFCGLGPDFCSPANCISTCDQKSECDPGWGSQWSSSETCPLNVCCSKFGFCGTTEEFCGDKTVANPSCAASARSSSGRTIGYYEGWAVGRPIDAMTPEKIPAGAYTHLNFAFASIDPNSFTVATASPGDEDLYRRVTNLKTIYRGLQVWISIGGWTFNDPDQPTARTFSQLAASTSAQQAFFASLVSFMSTYGFDGVDIDWEYPVAEERSGAPGDKDNFVSLMANMRSYFQSTGHNYGISLTLPSSYWYLQHFDLVGLQKHIDWFNMMSYDLHGTWDAASVYLGPKVAAHTNLTEIDQALKLLWRNNIDPKKVSLGLGFYGRSFALSDPSCTAPGCPFSGPAPAGPSTQSAGTLSYGEIKALIPTGTTRLDSQAAVRILTYGGNNWVSYDDATTLGMKLAYADGSCLGGTMVWAVSTDSADGELSSFLSGGQVVNPSKFSVGIVVLGDSAPSTGQCRWINCGESCPGGFAPAALAGGGLATSDRQCPSGQTRSFCCPADLVPTCHWSPTFLGTCSNNCGQSEVNVGSSTNGCWFGSRSLCCENRLDTTAIGNCDWVGDSPFCSVIPFTDATCPATQIKLTSASRGDGGESFCAVGYKSLCCNNPPPWKNCAWYRQQSLLDFLNVLHCPGTCPPGKAVVSVDSSQLCGSGKAAYCCDPPDTIPASFPNAGLDGGSKTLTDLWNKWLSNPVCDPTGDGNGPPTQVSARRRDLSLQDTVQAWAAAKRDSSNSPTTSWLIAALVGPALLQSLVGSAPVINLQHTWESLIAAAGSAYNGLTIFRLQQVLNTVPDLDPVSFVDWLLCAGTDASNSLGDLHAAEESLCVCQLGSTAKARLRRSNDTTDSLITTGSASDIESLTRRIFSENTNPDFIVPTNSAGAPGVARVLRAISQGELRFEYFNFFRYDSGGPGNQIALEVAYLLGPDMEHLRSDLQHLRVPSESTGPRYDRFVILHYHFRSINVGGTRMLGISQVNVRHGNQVRIRIDGFLNAANAGYYRVQATQHRQATVALACESGSNSVANTAWCPVNGPPTQPNNNRYAQFLAGATTASDVQGIFDPLRAPFSGDDGSSFLPNGVDWVNGNWPDTASSRSGFSFDRNGHWYNPIALQYTTDNGFLSASRFSTVNPGEN